MPALFYFFALTFALQLNSAFAAEDCKQTGETNKAKCQSLYDKAMNNILDQKTIGAAISGGSAYAHQRLAPKASDSAKIIFSNAEPHRFTAEEIQLIKSKAEELVQKANEAYERAKALHEALGEKYTKKTVASDHIKAISGWAEKPEGYTNTSPESVKTHADHIGHEPTRAGAMDQKHTGGFDGKYNCSHSEKQIWTEKPNEPIGSSREVCPDCQGFGSKQAISTGRPNVVAGPEGTHVYHPDGSYEFIPRN